MATLDSNCLTLADWAKRIGPDTKPARIIEMLSQKNDILLDMPFLEGNLPTGHRTTARTMLPTAEWRRLNKGVGKSKSGTRQMDIDCGMLETYAEVDKELADLNGNTAAFRLSESTAFIEGMSQQMAEALFYGDPADDPAGIRGLSLFYNSTSAESGQNIIDLGGTGTDNTSIWLIGWGEQSIHGVFPKGSQAGLQHQDLGEQTLLDDDGKQYQGYRDHYKWKTGVAVRNWQQAVRIANISISALKSKSGAPDLAEALIAAMHKLQDLGGSRPAFYMNRTISTYFDIQALNKPSLGITTVKGTEGQFWNEFRGVPFRRVDKLKNSEAKVA